MNVSVDGCCRMRTEQRILKKLGCEMICSGRNIEHRGKSRNTYKAGFALKGYRIRRERRERIIEKTVENSMTCVFGDMDKVCGGEVK